MAIERNPEEKPITDIPRDQYLNRVINNQVRNYELQDLNDPVARAIPRMAKFFELGNRLDFIGSSEEAKELVLRAMKARAARIYTGLKLTQIDALVVGNEAGEIPLLGEPIERFGWGVFGPMFVDPDPAKAAFEAGISEGVENVLDLLSSDKSLFPYTKEMLEKKGLAGQVRPSGTIFSLETSMNGVTAEYMYGVNGNLPHINIAVSKV